MVGTPRWGVAAPIRALLVSVLQPSPKESQHSLELLQLTTENWLVIAWGLVHAVPQKADPEELRPPPQCESAVVCTPIILYICRPVLTEVRLYN